MRTSIVIVLFVACALNVFSQQLSSQARAQAIAESFSKHKSAVKEKYGVRMEKYKDVKSQPVVKQNVADYSGTYEAADLSYAMTIQVGTEGVTGRGSEAGRAFRLENAKIEGALLTASKVYENGTTETLEGVFMNRTSRTSPTDAGVTIFGLGVVLSAPIEANGNTYDKIFYQKR